MTENVEIKALQECLDEYMTQTGRHEIDDMEANSALARAGLPEHQTHVWTVEDKAVENHCQSTSFLPVPIRLR